MSIIHLIDPIVGDSLDNIYVNSVSVQGIMINGATGPFVQQLPNKAGTIALLSDIANNDAYYASLTYNANSSLGPISSATSYGGLTTTYANAVQTYSNFVVGPTGGGIIGVQYTGTVAQYFKISFSVEMTSSGAYPVSLNLYRNGVATTCFCYCQTNSSYPVLLYMDIMLQLAPNDLLQVFQLSSTSQTLTIYNPSLQVFLV
jgi:hypothetical protein